MSLRNFHVVFINCSVILMIWFGFWAVGNFQQQREAEYLWTGVSAFTLALSLMVYEFLFLKKVKV